MKEHDATVTHWMPLPPPEEDDKPLTNADRIRAMRDEELAELLSDGCAGAVCYDKEQNAYFPVGCYKCRLEWLQQPAEEV